MKRLLAIAMLSLLSACAAPLASRQGTEPVTVGIIAINDFHGALEAPSAPVELPDGNGGIAAVKAGGAARLATAIDELRAKYPFNAVVSAGDLISGSPITSSLFLDEPTIGAMNRIGLDFNAMGNHEFDRGQQELLRMQNGGCERHTLRQPCAVEREFLGAKFRFLAASTFKRDGSTLFPASAIKRFGEGKRQVTVGFIGLTLKDTDSLVPGEGIEGLTFGDEAEAINAATARLKEQGAAGVVVLIHQGGYATGKADPNTCEGFDGAILPIIQRLDSRVDLVASGHTHQAYVCRLDQISRSGPLLLTSAGYYGRLVTEIALTIDPAANRVIAAEARNLAVDRAVFAERSDIADYVGSYARAVEGQKGRAIGKLSNGTPRPLGGTGGALGNLIADAHLAATRGAGAQIAFTNPFGIRDGLVPGTDGTVTFGQIYAVQPFFNTLVTYTLTGAELKAVLEQGLDGDGPDQLLAPSADFSYSFDRSRPMGQRIARMALGGQEIDPTADYRITTNSFLAGGKDGFTMLLKGRDAVTGGSDLDALEDWIGGVAIRQIPTEERVIEAKR